MVSIRNDKTGEGEIDRSQSSIDSYWKISAYILGIQSRGTKSNKNAHSCAWQNRPPTTLAMKCSSHWVGR